MDEKWRNDMSLMSRRIDNVLKAMRDCKDEHMQGIWNIKLQQLFEIRKAKAYERFEDQARMVH
jgi:hypothetical protein